MSNFIPFFFDGNQWHGTIDGVEKLWEALRYYTIGDLLEAKIATVTDISGLPENYHMGAMGVRSGALPSFGYRREHIGGNTTLEEWAKNRGMDLRKLAEERPMA